MKIIKEFVFPPLCFHCDGRLEEGRKILCASCLEHLVLIDPVLRCPVCFAPKEKKCKECSSLVTVGAAFENEGPVVSLLHHFIHGKRFALARALAPLLVAQLYALKWPLPDLIVPVPKLLAHRLVRGYNPARLLAIEMAKLLSLPLAPVHSKKIADKTLLLIDCKTGPGLQHAALQLKEGFSARLFALTLL